MEIGAVRRTRVAGASASTTLHTISRAERLPARMCGGGAGPRVERRIEALQGVTLLQRESRRYYNLTDAGKRVCLHAKSMRED